MSHWKDKCSEISRHNWQKVMKELPWEVPKIHPILMKSLSNTILLIQLINDIPCSTTLESSIEDNKDRIKSGWELQSKSGSISTTFKMTKTSPHKLCSMQRTKRKDIVTDFQQFLYTILVRWLYIVLERWRLLCIPRTPLCMALSIIFILEKSGSLQ